VVALSEKVAVSYLQKRLRFGIKLGLERITRMLEIAGRPQDSFSAIIVGGTNGKGSVSHILAKVLSESGYKVGLYTSPHLVSYRERIRINGVPISERAFEELVKWADEIADKIEHEEGFDTPTEFEILTLVACKHFANEGVQIAVMEVGLGGRYDATNALSPILSIITTIALDHTDRLGSTWIEIANEKLGITRPHVPLITAEHKFSVLNHFHIHCCVHEIPLYVVGKDVRWRKLSASPEGICGDYSTWKGDYPQLSCSLGGDFQFPNLGCVVGAFELLREMGVHITEDALRNGSKKVRCFGRLDVLKREPLIVADGAHNPASAYVLSRSLRTLFSYKRLGLVIGVMRDKDVHGILEALMPVADVAFLTQSRSERALEATKLKEIASRWGKTTYAFNSVLEAYEAAKDWASHDDMICVTGSIYVLGELPEYQSTTLSPI
jgi:dihydrofolate synthase/folylpolyglutamate synthase